MLRKSPIAMVLFISYNVTTTIKSIIKMKKIAIHTLGCRANQLESSIISDKFVEYGWQVVNFSEKADIYVINTCTVTANSDNSSRYYVRKAKAANPAAKIVVAGCYPQVSAKETAEINGVDLVLGNAEKLELADLIVKQDILSQNNGKIYVSDVMKEEKFRDKTVLSASGRVRATIKIQDGCNYRCSYCIIPYARGKSRSNELSGIINHIKGIAENGFSEVVLSGIHLGQWGLDLKPQNRLLNLLKEIETIPELKRYRLSSMDPGEFNDDLINFLANSKKLCRHLHISLQSGNNEILKAMKRRYTVQDYSKLINMLVEKIPFINIGSDIIVGFPGESEEQFRDTYKNLKILPIGYIHVFTYSKRKGTPAAQMPKQVDTGVKKQRNKILSGLAMSKNFEFRQKMANKEFFIIAENFRDKKTGLLKGMTDNFISVITEGPDELKNQMVRVKISKVDHKNTYGTLL